jgi:nitrate/nitrite transporter NarK
VVEGFPKRERALGTGLFNAGSNIGAVVAPGVVPWLTLRCGWDAAFVVVGAVGFVLMAFWLATALIGLAAATHAGWAANLFTMVSDMFPKQAVASVVGLGGMFGSGTAMLFSESAGFILQTTGSYWSLFCVAGCAYLLALAAMHALTPRMTPVEFRHP